MELLNICGLKGKTDELISSMSPRLPHILCFSEHHLKHTELEQINIEGFKLCTAYCRQAIKMGGVCIFIQRGLEYSKIDVNKYSKDQDAEICMLNLKTTSLKAKGSHGYDGITTKILKISAPFISCPLSYIFNKSMISGIFPTRLKYATIKPIFKNGDKKNVANYRPISILPSFSKILEKIM